jgi:hypothetical protein
MPHLSPYGWRESLRWLWRNVAGPSRANPAGLQSLPSVVQLNDAAPRCRVVFIGDLMGLRGLRLRIAPGARQFVQDGDALVANLEGVITDARRRLPIDQAHDRGILEALAEFFPPEKTFISVANNHAADFGERAFRETVEALDRAGFHVFGPREAPAVSLPFVNLVTGTQWLNRTGDFVAPLNEAARYRSTDRLNVMFPHWGYELEFFPRAATIAQGHRWLDDFDAVIGHHSHTPQPVVAVDGPRRPTQLLAYSLGDFCYGRRSFARCYAFGLILKVEFGQTADGRRAIGRVQWQNIGSIIVENNAVRVDLL